MSKRGLGGTWAQKLTTLIAGMKQLADGQVHGELVKVCAKVIVSQEKKEIQVGVDPFGARYPQPKDLGQGRALFALFRTGKLFASAFAEPEGGNVRFGFGARPGQKRIWGRLLIPDVNHSLGPVWGPRVLGSMRQALGKFWKQQNAGAMKAAGSDGAT